MRSWSVTNNWLPGSIPTLPPPLFPQTCPEKEEERDKFSPTINKLSKGSKSQFLFLSFIFLYLCTIYKVYIIYICTHLLLLEFRCGPAEQPPLDPNGKALNQPKPHPLNRTV